MGKNTFHGWAKPDDPIYQRGPVIGGIRFYGPPKAGKPVSPPKASPKATRKVSPKATKEGAAG